MEFLNYFEKNKYYYAIQITGTHFNNLTSIEIEELMDDVANIWMETKLFSTNLTRIVFDNISE